MIIDTSVTPAERVGAMEVRASFEQLKEGLVWREDVVRLG